jgi:hypothetical protein
MKKVGVIMQPHYLPWLGYFELLYKSDIFVFYDHVQFEKQSWQQRNRILDSKGQISMLTLPVVYGNGLDRKINEVQIDLKQKPIQKHLNALKMNYGKAPFFKVLFPEIENLYMEANQSLIALETSIIKWAASNWGMHKEIIFASDLNVVGNKVEALIDVCKKVNIDVYYSPAGSKEYIDENNLFLKNDIELIFQSYVHPKYTQFQSQEFVSHLSFIDFIMNHGFDTSVFTFK